MKTHETILLPMPIIVGAPRSGTTLLRLMLDAHPQLCVPPETGFMAHGNVFESLEPISRHVFFDTVTHHPVNSPNWSDFQIQSEVFWDALQLIEPFTPGEGMRLFYRLYAERMGKPRWGDKTPRYSFYMQRIARHLPEAHFIHIIRDGRDTALSIRDLWFSPGKDMVTLANHWRDTIIKAREQAQGLVNYREILYEDLIANPEVVLRQLCEYVQLEYDSAMLNYHARSHERLSEFTTRYTVTGQVIATRNQRLEAHRLTTQPPDESRVFVWKNEMSAEERQTFAEIAGDVLAELGYEV